jgi:hypothetical protein
MLPYLSGALLLVVFLGLEWKSFRDRMSEGQAAPGGGTFVRPPGDGYHYYVSADCVVFIRPSGWYRFRVYMVRGTVPDTPLRQDRYGTYFAAKSRDTATVEEQIDSLYGV